MYCNCKHHVSVVWQCTWQCKAMLGKLAMQSHYPCTSLTLYDIPFPRAYR